MKQTKLYIRASRDLSGCTGELRTADGYVVRDVDGEDIALVKENGKIVAYVVNDKAFLSIAQAKSCMLAHMKKQVRNHHIAIETLKKRIANLSSELGDRDSQELFWGNIWSALTDSSTSKK